MKAEILLTNFVWVRLTDEGMKHLAQFGEAVGHGYHKFQLYSLMIAYASCYAEGKTNLIINDLIVLTNPI